VTEADRHVGVVGAGIVGLAVARQLQRDRPGTRVTVWETRDTVGAEQTGHNSGVVHAGVYYEPGSLKAELCRRGNDLLRAYCAERGIAVEELGKLVVAATVDERAPLTTILERARRNGVPDVRWLEGTDLNDVEPYVAGVAAVHSPHTAVVDFAAVAAALAADVEAAGGEVRLGERVRAADEAGASVTVTAVGAPVRVDRLVVCAGLGTDGVARRAGRSGDVRIVPFRGEYHRLVGSVRHRVKGLIYPVPDPRYPFLGVHLTRTHDGEVLVGPNAVPALALDGYRRRDVDPVLLARLAVWPGGRRLARKHWRTGVHELTSSLWKPAFAAAARRYLPSLRTRDLLPAPSGVRAQAVDRRGGIVDDFVVDISGRVAIVRNAPSPAATSSLAIAEHIVRRLGLGS
jgi:L-2-hydroxyglutarate oxidase LhgO